MNVKSLKGNSSDLGGQFHMMGVRNEAAEVKMSRLLGCGQIVSFLLTKQSNWEPRNVLKKIIWIL